MYFVTLTRANFILNVPGRWVQENENFVQSNVVQVIIENFEDTQNHLNISYIDSEELANYSIFDTADIELQFDVAVFFLRRNNLEQPFQYGQATEQHLTLNDVHCLNVKLFVEMFKANHEIFSCGCLQRAQYNFYKLNEVIFFKSFLNVYKCVKEGSPILKKYPYVLKTNIDAVDCFKYIVEMIFEFVKCKIIDQNNCELSNKRIPMLLELLLKVPMSSFPECCNIIVNFLHRIEDNSDISKRRKIYRQIVTQIFSFVEKNRKEIKLDNALSAVVLDGKYEELDEFAHPLMLLKIISKGEEAWSSCEQLFIKYAKELSLDSSSSDFHIKLIYLIDLALGANKEFTVIIPILNGFAENFNKYNAAQKCLAMRLLENVEVLNENLHNLVEIEKKKIFSNLDPSHRENCTYVAQSVKFLSEKEFEELAKRKMPTDTWLEIFNDSDNYARLKTNNDAWEMAIKLCEHESAISFLVEAMQQLGEKKFEHWIKRRFEQIMNNFKTEDVATITKMSRLFISFSIAVLSSQELVKLFTHKFHVAFNAIFELLIIYYCFGAEKFDNDVDFIARLLYNTISDGNPQIAAGLCVADTDDFGQCLKYYCEVSKRGFSRKDALLDAKVWCNNSQWYKILYNVYVKPPISFDESMAKNARNRIIEVFSGVFCALSNELASIGTTGTSGFARFSTLLCKHINSTSDFSTVERLADGVIQAFTKFDTNWSILFVKARIYEILKAAGTTKRKRLIARMKRRIDVEEGECSDEGSPGEKRVRMEDDDDFVIDTTASTIEEEDDSVEEGEVAKGSPSRWERSLKRFLLDEAPQEKPKNDGRSKIKCFNCDGEHCIQSCPAPKDYAKIRMAKLAFMQKQNNNSNTRYHANSSGQSSSSKYKPGRLSSDLRSALNIGPDDIPEWIYRMRKMGFVDGYPPGYLKKALKFDDSNSLITFHMDSTNLNIPESCTDQKKPPPIVDDTKVMYYMGFNNTYRALRDREKFHVPPFQTFCEMLQKGVTEKHNASEDARILEATMLKAKKDMEKADEIKVDDDEIVIDRNPTNDEEAEGDGRCETPDMNTSSMGESISVIVGTPIVSQRVDSGEWKKQSIPDLDKFAVGIVPFEANEEVGERGIFKKIMTKIRGYSTGAE
ncbi:unnamed protein product [Caenorhabditis bovis]|uniref:PSP proline-rich domain-containing protein n=1 Tax=Caenorhabditis bovis TaxID=2654633 RepID=A0A8S1FDW7_9PELO|nr:unnamed protein product [Caenorhabditis bovis]